MMKDAVLGWGLFSTVFIVQGLLVTSGVSGRSTAPPTTGTNGANDISTTAASSMTDAPQPGSSSATPATTATSGSELTPSATGTSTAPVQSATMSTAAAGQTETASVTTAVSATAQASSASGCMSVVELSVEMCMLQTLQDAMPCDADADCFLPNQICCPHYCETRVCKNVNGEGASAVDTTGVDDRYRGEVVPKHIKHRQNVPTIDELAADFVKDAAKSPTAIIQPTPSLQPSMTESAVSSPMPSMTESISSSAHPTANVIPTSSIQSSMNEVSPSSSQPSVTESLPSSVQPPSTSNIVSSTQSSETATMSIHHSATVPVSPMQTATSDRASSSTVQPLVSATPSVMTSSASVETIQSAATTASPANIATTTATGTAGFSQECPSLTCVNSCMYGRKVDALGCSVCDCLFNDKCPRVLPIPRILCLVRLRMTSTTCDKDVDCTQGHICCPGACGNNVCRRVVRETFRTLSILSSS